MINILKIGDKIYGQSLQYNAKSYFSGFPQREQYLLQFVKRIKFYFYKHKLIKNIDDIIKEKLKFENYLKDKNFDYLLIDNPFSSLIISRKIQIPLIFDAIDWYDEMYLKEFGINKKYYLLRYGLLDLLKRSEKVISQSPVLLDSLKTWGLKTNKTIVIPNGYDKNIFYTFSKGKISKLKKAFEKKHKISIKNKKIIVYTGKVGKWYEDLKIITKAILKNQLFFIVGDGPLLSEIQESENIIKCGAVPIIEVPDYTNIADALVFPVSVDCSPIAVSEYLAVGKPIVMGRGRMEWLLQDGKTGRMVNSTKSVYCWKQGIFEAIKNKNQYKKYNLKLSKKLSWQVLSKKFENFIGGK